MLVLKSTHEQMKAEAKASGKALSELVGELIEGMESLGFDPQPKHVTDTTAKRVIGALKWQKALATQLTEDVASLRLALAAANAKLQPFLDRRAVATRNLKQFRKPVIERLPPLY